MTIGYRIDKGVPLPKSAQKGGGRKPVYPFGRMEVGDSFFVPLTKATPHRIYNTAYQYTKRHGGSPKFKVRVVEGGCRCWRVKDDVVSYPAILRLSPEGTHYICNTCNRQWFLGEYPGCTPCQAAWNKVSCRFCGHKLVGGVCPVVRCAGAAKLI